MSLRAGIIGAGGVAGLGLLGTDKDVGKKRSESSHAGGYAATDGVDLVAIADPNDDRRQTFGEAWNIPQASRYRTHREMLEAEKLDIVSVCTPTLMHKQHALDALDARPKAIWCEKPIATSVADAEAITAKSEETGVPVIVNHSFRFDPKLVQLRTLLQQERILGEVRAVQAAFRMELMRNSTHLLDTIYFLLDKAPLRASGWLNGRNEATEKLGVDREVDDQGGGGWLVLEDDLFVTIDCTVERDISSMSYLMTGTQGKLYLNNDDGEWRYWRLRDGDHTEAPLPGIESGWTWQDDYQATFRHAAAHILEVIDGKTANRSTPRDATRSLETIAAFYASHHTGSHITLPLAAPLKNIEIRSW